MPRLRHLLLAPLLLAALGDGATAGSSGPRALIADATLLGGRLRVGAKVGDFALVNGSVTAVIRKSDGWLVDFWPNRPAPPTAPQLKLEAAIDGLWQLHPTLNSGAGPENVTAESVRIDGDSVLAVSTLALGAGTVRVSTRYRLDQNRPKLDIETRIEHVSGGKVTLTLGDAVKWGNVDYFVEGEGRTKPTFSGRGHWVGRRGAGGDLILESLTGSDMRIHYRSRHDGLAPEVFTQLKSTTLLVGSEITLRRTLRYQPIPEPTKWVPKATLIVDVGDEMGRPLAAKLTFKGLSGTPDPFFGNDGDENGAGRFAWSGTGRFVRTLPVGKYSVLATAGIERDAARFTVNIEEGQNVFVKGKLSRVIATPGQVAADLHLHQAPSVDADIALSTRIVSVAAEGLELAVASDHYAVTDFAPTVAKLMSSGALARPVLTVVGSEISTVGNRFGHFNLMPMKRGDFVAYEDTTPKKLFADMRRVSPHGIIQVNHPRWDDIGYFARYKLDPKTTRVPYQYKDEFDEDYDALEVFNGYDSMSQPKIRMVLFDWIRLLGQGHRYVATGNSDSHKLFFVDPGMPRNLITYGSSESDAQDLSADPKAVLAGVKAGRVVVTSGPIIQLDVDGKGPGQSVSAGKHTVHVVVKAAPWIDVDVVEVLLGPKGNRIRYLPVPSSKVPVRLDKSFDLDLQPGSFVLVIAAGNTPLPNVDNPAVRPFGFTNPVFVE